MKITNIALHTVLAVIGTASRASAKGFFRGSVEKKEDVRRKTMGDQVLKKYLDKCADGLGQCESDKTCGALIAQKITFSDQLTGSMPAVDNKGLLAIAGNTKYMEACYEVARDNKGCLGCQGYELEETEKGAALTGRDQGMVHIPGCLNMSQGDCLQYAQEILSNHPDWFPDSTAAFTPDYRQVTSKHEQWYWLLGVPVDGTKAGYLDGPTVEASEQTVQGLAGDCMVHYPYMWCLAINTGKGPETRCDQLAPFDCTGPDKTCLTVGKCCEKINGNVEDNIPALYMWPDINGNKLQCYAWPINTPAETLPTPVPDTGTNPTGTGVPGTKSTDVAIDSTSKLRLIIHLNHALVVLPAIITARKDFVVEADNGITTVFDEKNINKWTQDFDNLDEDMTGRGRGIPKLNESLEKIVQLEMAQANNDVWAQDPAKNYKAGVGYYAGTGTDGAVID